MKYKKTVIAVAGIAAATLVSGVTYGLASSSTSATTSLSMAPGDGLTISCPNALTLATTNANVGTASCAPDAPPSTTADPTPTPTSTTPVPTTTAPPPPPAYPTADTTGVPAGTTLTTITGNFTTNSSLVENKHITGDLIVDDPNLIVRNTWVEGKVTNAANPQTFTLDHVTVGKTSGCNGDVAVQAKNYTATAVKVQGFGDAFRSTDKTGATTTGTSNITIKDSYAKLCGNPGDHSDGFQGYYGGSNVLIQHNTIDQGDVANDQVTAPVFNSDYSKGLTLTGNLLIGGSFTIRLDSDGKNNAASKSVVTNNFVVADEWVYGPVHSDCSQITTWSGNVVGHLTPGTYTPSDAGTTLNCA